MLYAKQQVTLIFDEQVDREKPVACYYGNGKVYHFKMQEMKLSDFDELHDANNVQDHESHTTHSN